MPFWRGRELTARQTTCGFCCLIFSTNCSNLPNTASTVHLVWTWIYIYKRKWLKRARLSSLYFSPFYLEFCKVAFNKSKVLVPCAGGMHHWVNESLLSLSSACSAAFPPNLTNSRVKFHIKSLPNQRNGKCPETPASLAVWFFFFFKGGLVTHIVSWVWVGVNWKKKKERKVQKYS